MRKELNEMRSQDLEEAHNDPGDFQLVEIVEKCNPEQESVEKDEPGLASLGSDPLQSVPVEETMPVNDMALEKYWPLMVGGDEAAVEEEEEWPVLMTDASGRERLKRHRTEVAGHVWIPDIWGQEDLLKDWVDCSAFDAQLVSGRIMSARAALVEEGRRTNTGGLRI